MSDVSDLNFAGADDAKAKLRAAMAYLLNDTTGIDRDLMALAIMEILRQVANGLPSGSPPIAPT
jgi:hypothetical protein